MFKPLGLNPAIVERLRELFKDKVCIDCGQQAERKKQNGFYCHQCALSHERSENNKIVGFYDFSRIYQSPLPIEHEESIVEDYLQDEIVDFLYRNKIPRRKFVKHKLKGHR